MRSAWATLILLNLLGCAPGERRFPLRDPIWHDTDLQSVNASCHRAPSARDPDHVSCAPKPRDWPRLWGATDALVFRPLSHALAIASEREAVNVNSLDEVPDSAWFTNRRGAAAIRLEDLPLGACDRSLLLDPEGASDGAWIVDQGKMNGAASGFRVNVPGMGRYLFKADYTRQPELSTAASVVGAAIYAAAGFNTTCEQIVYFRPSLLKLAAGLRYRPKPDPWQDDAVFDRGALDHILQDCVKRDGLVRMSASAWVPGYVLGPFGYEGTRLDDPNDVIPHEDRRELRGARLLAAWIDFVDSRDAKGLDSWLVDRVGVADGSPGHVVHYYLDTSSSLGRTFGSQDAVNRRLGYGYVEDIGGMAGDLITLGIPTRPWDRVRAVPGHELFGYFNVDDFVPDDWRMQYFNPAYSRMTERDGAWMARILARFSPEMVRTLADMARFSDSRNTRYLATVLEGRLERILERYLTRLSPVDELKTDGPGRVCGIDRAAARGVPDAASFHYVARWSHGAGLRVERRAGGQVCVQIPHVAADGGAADDAPSRYVSVRLEDGVALGPLIVHLYDLGSDPRVRARRARAARAVRRQLAVS